MGETVEQYLAQWTAQSPTCVVTPSERRFIQDMRQAATSGVGYGWMQSIIEVEWRSKDESGALGPRQAMAWLQKAEAEHDAAKARVAELEDGIRAALQIVDKHSTESVYECVDEVRKLVEKPK